MPHCKTSYVATQRYLPWPLSLYHLVPTIGKSNAVVFPAHETAGSTVHMKNFDEDHYRSEIQYMAQFQFSYRSATEVPQLSRAAPFNRV